MAMSRTHWSGCAARKSAYSEAMKNGASDEEIAELMDELRRANENYINQLQRETARNGETQERQQGMRR